MHKGVPIHAFDVLPVTKYDGGLGAFANRDIKKGELILSDDALVIITEKEGASPDEIEKAANEAVAAETEQHRAAIFELSDIHAVDGNKTLSGILRTNVYPVS